MSKYTLFSDPPAGHPGPAPGQQCLNTRCFQTHLRGTLARRLANKLRIQRREEEERRRQEELERDRRDREQEAAAELAIEESLKSVPQLTTSASWPLGLLAPWSRGPLASWPLGLLASWPLGLLASSLLGSRLSPRAYHHSSAAVPYRTLMHPSMHF